jgi:CBS domain
VTTAHTALHAGEIASAPVITVESDVDALAALRIMQRNQIHHLLVFAGGRCNLWKQAQGSANNSTRPGHAARWPTRSCRARAPRAEIASLRMAGTTIAPVPAFVCTEEDLLMLAGRLR